ncbi:MAG: HlyD family efflux transporter periplasmic adaptor subunit [Bacteroidaceae bacterium]|nr:HlyD family efflux transporter periplasmic adaptor subunit [Prevotellaceae bacterium]MDY5632710.1 HlyD family efflux transporter periplasmic adaptor subunit [Bacteroidaceae bacterium]
MTVFLLLTWIIKYPDTVDGYVSITGLEAPVRLVSHTSGRLHLLKNQGEHITRKDPIALVENGAVYEDVIKLKIFLDSKEKTPIAKNLVIGELTESYNSYLIAKDHWERLASSERHTNMRKSMEGQIKANQEVVLQIRHSMDIKNKVRTNYHKEYRRDSSLASKGLISQSQLENTQNAYLQQLDAEVALKNSLLSKQSEISTSRMEIARSHIEEAESMEEAYVNMMVKRNILETQLRLWEEKYLITAPIDGELQYLGFWRENVAVQSGMELFSVLPPYNKLIGEADIPANGVGKIRIGQEVNVKLNEYPYDEFGLLKGVVRRIAPLSKKEQGNESMAETYQVQISFPNGARTNFGHHLNLNFESKGSAEIITEPKRLIERLFDNLKANATK